MIRKKIVIVGDGACGKERYITTLHTVQYLSLQEGASKIQRWAVRKKIPQNANPQICGPLLNLLD